LTFPCPGSPRQSATTATCPESLTLLFLKWPGPAMCRVGRTVRAGAGQTGCRVGGVDGGENWASCPVFTSWSWARQQRRHQ
jgi:hypothetical protein